MHKYDEIGDRLISMAGRKRDMKQIEARAALETIQKEYEAYTDGVLDAVKAIRAAQSKEGD